MVQGIFDDIIAGKKEFTVKASEEFEEKSRDKYLQTLKKALQNVPVNLTWEDKVGKLEVFSKKTEVDDIIEAVESDEQVFVERILDFNFAEHFDV